MIKYEIKEGRLATVVTQTIGDQKPQIIANFFGYGKYGNGKSVQLRCIGKT